MSVLALWRDLSHKEIGAAVGIPQKRVSLYLRRGEIPEEVLDRLLAAMKCSPAAVHSVTACLESLEALERESDIMAEEKAEIEDAVLRDGRVIRQGLIEAARLSRIHAAQELPESHAIACDEESTKKIQAGIWDVQAVREAAHCHRRLVEPHIDPSAMAGEAKGTSSVVAGGRRPKPRASRRLNVGPAPEGGAV